MKKTMYILYKIECGYKNLNVVADSREKIIKYLDRKYTRVYVHPDGHAESYPCWNKNAFIIREEEIEVL